MTWYRKYPLFASLLTLCAVLAAGEAGWIFERSAVARSSAEKLAKKRGELQAMSQLVPAPKRDVAEAIGADLAGAQRSLATMQAALQGRGPAAERLRQARHPRARTDAYFDLATFVERTRELARKNAVDVRRDAARLGFSAYANEGPELERIEPIFRQRQSVQYLAEALIEARPLAILAVKREVPLTRAEREERALAVKNAAPVDPGAEPAATAADEGPDFFTIDPRISVRAPGFLESTAFRFVFIGQTAVLRAFLNRLAAFELPVLVREVEVEPVSAEEALHPAAGDDVAVEPAPAPASVVLTLGPAPAPARKAIAGPAIAPIVGKPYSKFTVTVEYLELMPSPAPAVDGAPAMPAPTP